MSGAASEGRNETAWRMFEADRASKGLGMRLVEARDGYAVVIDELEIGLTAIAAPIRGVEAQVIASVSASGPTFRVAHRVPAVVKAVVEAGQQISVRMGWSGG